jgi:dihydroxyacetone kinase-like predicted kinase
VPSARRAVVLLPPAAGLERLFADAGAVVLAPETGTPSTQEVITAIDGTGASEVVVLPNDPNALGVVQQAAALARADHPDRLVAVIPTRSAVQALAAIAVSDPARSYGDDVIAMTSAAGATRYAGVTRAVRAALTGAGPCDPGDVLGVLEGDIVIVAPVRAAGEPAARPGRPAPPPDPLGYVARRLVERMLLGGGELVTLVAGRDAPAGFAEQLAEQLRIAHPGVDVVSVVGGQPRYPLLVGVE